MHGSNFYPAIHAPPAPASNHHADRAHVALAGRFEDASDEDEPKPPASAPAPSLNEAVDRELLPHDDAFPIQEADESRVSTTASPSSSTCSEWCAQPWGGFSKTPLSSAPVVRFTSVPSAATSDTATLSPPTASGVAATTSAAVFGCAIGASHVVMGGGAPFVATPARAVRACLRCNGDTGGVQLRLLPVDAVAEAAAAAAIAGAAAGDPRYHVVRCNATKRAGEGGSSGGGAPTLPRPAPASVARSARCFPRHSPAPAYLGNSHPRSGLPSACRYQDD